MPLIDAGLVSGLIAAQFPQWADLAVEPIEPGGWDNRTFRLGFDMSVRLPSARRYVPQIRKEHRWLPKLAPRLPLPIPEPMALGRPAPGYPWHWSIYRWIDGEVASQETIHDGDRFAADLASFLNALRRIDATRGPKAGRHNFFRGGDLRIYDKETRAALGAAGDSAPQAEKIWDRACASQWKGDPVWVHGDIAAGNLITREGKLAAIIDFGSCGTGDPACDLVIAWTLFDPSARRVFQEAANLDSGTWDRARGWALWKALTTLHDKGNRQKTAARQALRALLSDPLPVTD